jgi:hypothetical protein
MLNLIALLVALSAADRPLASAQPRNPKMLDAQAATGSQDPNEVRLPEQPRPNPNSAVAPREHRDEEAYETIGAPLADRVAIATVLAALLQAILIAFQVRIASRQNAIIRKQNAIMEQQREAAHRQSGYMRESLEEARNASGAAQKSASAAIMAVELAYRAYIAVDECRLAHLMGGVQVDLTIRNRGESTALIEEVRLSYPDSARTRRWTPRGLDPEQTCEISIAIPLKPDEAKEAIHSGEWEVRGAILYSDRFATRLKRFAYKCRSDGYCWIIDGLALNDEVEIPLDE